MQDDDMGQEEESGGSSSRAAQSSIQNMQSIERIQDLDTLLPTLDGSFVSTAKLAGIPTVRSASTGAFRRHSSIYHSASVSASSSPFLPAIALSSSNTPKRISSPLAQLFQQSALKSALAKTASSPSVLINGSRSRMRESPTEMDRSDHDLLLPPASSPLSPNHPSLRWLVLFLSCLLLFGNYYAYDNPAALNKPLQEYLGHDYDLYQYELNLLYSVYSFPNMFIPFIGGQLVDRCDTRKILLGFSLIVCVGQTIFTLGVNMKHFGIMLLGRALFGIGGEAISVVQASISTEWFKHKELAFALGLNLCIARFGSVMNSILSPRIQKWYDVPTAIWFGSFMCYLSFVSSFCLCFFVQSDGSPMQTDTVTRPETHYGEGGTTSKVDEGMHQDVGYMEMISDTLSSVKKLPKSFWLICLVCVCLYGTVVPFNTIASDFLMSKWYPNDTATAGLVMSIPDTLSAILVPVWGFVVDEYGQRATQLMVCSLAIALVHLTLALTMILPIYPLFLLGVCYSVYAVAIWPSIALVVQHQQEEEEEEEALLTIKSDKVRMIGTAYGISTSALNASLTLFPLVTANIRVGGTSFIPVLLFFASLAGVGAMASSYLWFLDMRLGGILQRARMNN